MMMSIFMATIISPTRRSAVPAPAPLRPFFFRPGSIKLAARTSSIGPAFIARTTIPPAAFLSIFAGVLRKPLARRCFVDPRRQHFQIDQFVEF